MDPNPSDNDSIKSDESRLSSDLKTVTESEVINGEEQLSYILNGRAIPSEAELWYMSRDPLGETVEEEGGLYLDNGKILEFIRRGVQEIVGYRNCAAVIMASVAFPELFSNSANNREWMTAVSKNIIDTADQDTADGPKIPYDDVIDLALVHINNIELDEEQMRLLTISCDMLESAVTLGRGFVLTSFGPGMVMLDEQYSDVSEGQGPGLKVSTAISAYCSRNIEDRIVNEVFGREKVVFDGKIKYALGQEWRRDARLLTVVESSRSSSESAGEASTILSRMIDRLRKSFLETEALTNPAMKAEAKGLLHELLWMLDGYMLIFSDKKYSDIAITPSMEFEDAPIVGRPELRRGYDFIAGIKGQKGNLLQLKSGSQEHGKSYHPEVRVLYEGNFQDFNYKRLDAKLAFYDRAIAKGLEDPDSIDILNKYVLKTVRVEFDRYSEYSARINDIRIDQAVHALRNSVQYDGQTFASRADRRKFEKTQRKQAKSRKGRLSSSSEE